MDKETQHESAITNNSVEASVHIIKTASFFQSLSSYLTTAAKRKNKH